MKTYNNYKNSGIDWIGGIPETWQIILFKRVIEKIKDGTHGSYVRVQKGRALLSAKNVFDDGLRLTDSESLVSEEDYNEIVKNGFPQKGDLLITCVGTIGRSFVYNLAYPHAFQRSVSFLRLRKNKAFPQYYKHFVQSDYYQRQLVTLAKTSAQSGVYMGDISGTVVVLPSLEEQTQIAQYLDHKTSQIDKLITDKEKLIELLHEERTAIINQAVTKGLNPDVPMKDSRIEWLGEVPEHWDVKKMKYVASINSAKSSFQFDKNSEQEVVFLPMEKVSEEGTITQNLRKKVSEANSGFTYFEKNDVLVAKITPCFENGKGAWLSTLETEFGFGSTEFHTIRATDAISSQFIFYLTKSKRFMGTAEAAMTGAAGQKRVPTNFIKDYKIGLPPLLEQEEIVKTISLEHAKIDLIAAKIGREIELLKEYKTALISEVVTGKVDVRDEVIAESTELVSLTWQ